MGKFLGYPFARNVITLLHIRHDTKMLFHFYCKRPKIIITEIKSSLASPNLNVKTQENSAAVAAKCGTTFLFHRLILKPKKLFMIERARTHASIHTRSYVWANVQHIFLDSHSFNNSHIKQMFQDTSHRVCV